MTGMRIVAVGVAAAVAAVAAIGGCSGGSGRGASADGGHAVSAAAAGASRAATGVSGDVQGPASAARDVVASYKIRTAAMTITVDKPDAVGPAADAAGAIATRYGGEVFADQRTSGRSASAVVTLTVPPGVLPAVLHALSMLGQEKSRSESTQNVTGEVIDVDTRVSNLTKMIDALEQLYDPTHRKLSELVDLEQQISDRESELESLQAQQRALRAQTDTATVTLTVQTKAAPHRHVGGFLGGLRHGWHAFLRGADALAIALGAVLPFALLASVVAIAARALWPRLGRRNVTPAAPE